MCRLSGCIDISAGISCVSRNPGAGILLNINSTSNTTAGPDTARRASCPAVINTPPTRATRVTTCQHTRGKVATIEFLQTDIFIFYGVYRDRVSWSWDDKSGSRELEFPIKVHIVTYLLLPLPMNAVRGTSRCLVARRPELSHPTCRGGVQIVPCCN